MIILGDVSKDMQAITSQVASSVAARDNRFDGLQSLYSAHDYNKGNCKQDLTRHHIKNSTVGHLVKFIEFAADRHSTLSTTS